MCPVYTHNAMRFTCEPDQARVLQNLLRVSWRGNFNDISASAASAR
jgi:hypothetical protein